MAADRDDLIDLACETLEATRYAGETKFGFRQGDIVYLVDDDAMARLGEMVMDGESAPYSRWFMGITAERVTAAAVVMALPEPCHLHGQALVALHAQAGGAGDYLTCAACDHFSRELAELTAPEVAR